MRIHAAAGAQSRHRRSGGGSGGGAAAAASGWGAALGVTLAFGTGGVSSGAGGGAGTDADADADADADGSANGGGAGDALPTEWSDQQRAAIDAVLAHGRSILLTGSAGSGKTAVARHIIAEMRRRHRVVQVVAPTGVAAHNIGGRTLHSAFGWKPAVDAASVTEAAMQTYGNRWLRRTLGAVGLLVVEEVSMVSPAAFAKIDRAMQLVRGCSHPFGGVQLLLLGDFAQLPPVCKSPAEGTPLALPRLASLTAAPPTAPPTPAAAAATAVWPAARPAATAARPAVAAGAASATPLAARGRRIELADDDDVVAAASCGSSGCGGGGGGGGHDAPDAPDAGVVVAEVAAAARSVFETAAFFNALDDVVQLNEVWRQRDARFVALLGRARIGSLTAADAALLADRVGADLGEARDGILATKIFARNADVDAINNTLLRGLGGELHTFAAASGVTLCGGIRGAAAAAEARAGLERARERLQRDLGLPTALQLKVGAQVLLTVNLSVGDGLFNGSRGVVVGFGPTVPDAPADAGAGADASADADAADSDADDGGGGSGSGGGGGGGYPLVRFINARGEPQVVRIEPNKWTHTERHKGVAHVAQVPLRLGWATTVHRAQGLSLDRAEMSLAAMFETGQAYTALSRVRSLAALRLREFDAAAFRADPRVVEFYTTPYAVQRAAYAADATSGVYASRRAATAAAVAGSGGALDRVARGVARAAAHGGGSSGGRMAGAKRARA